MSDTKDPTLRPGHKRLTVGDFDTKFSIDETGKLNFNNSVVETSVGLKRRDFILALFVACVTAANMVASWKNALKRAPAVAPVNLTCPAPVVNYAPPVPPTAPQRKETRTRRPAF